MILSAVPFHLDPHLLFPLRRSLVRTPRLSLRLNAQLRLLFTTKSLHAFLHPAYRAVLHLAARRAVSFSKRREPFVGLGKLLDDVIKVELELRKVLPVHREVRDRLRWPLLHRRNLMLLLVAAPHFEVQFQYQFVPQFQPHSGIDAIRGTNE